MSYGSRPQETYAGNLNPGYMISRFQRFTGLRLHRNQGLHTRNSLVYNFDLVKTFTITNTKGIRMTSFYDYDSRPTVRSIITSIACVIIAAFFLFAGSGKLAGLGQVPGQTEFLDRFIPDFIMTPEFARFIGMVFIPWILPIGEILIGLGLIIGIWPRVIAILVGLLSLGFMANNSYMISIGLDKYPTCECFGIWEQWFGGLTPMQSMYIDIGLFILALVIITLHPGPFFSHHFWFNRIFNRDKI